MPRTASQASRVSASSASATPSHTGDIVVGPYSDITSRTRLDRPSGDRVQRRGRRRAHRHQRPRALSVDQPPMREEGAEVVPGALGLPGQHRDLAVDPHQLCHELGHRLVRAAEGQDAVLVQHRVGERLVPPQV